MSNKLLMVALFCLLAKLNLRSQDMPGVITHPLDLQKELHMIQLFAPPSPNNSLEFDAGVFFYLPESERSADLLLFSKSLRYQADESGNAVAPVRVFENLESRETLYLNADDEVIFRIPPPYGYNPFWVLAAYYPELDPPGLMLEQYDPARVVMKAVLIPFRMDPASGAVLQPFVTEGSEKLQKSTGSGLIKAKCLGDKKPRSTSNKVTSSAVPIPSTVKLSTIARKPKIMRDVYVDVKSGDDAWNGKSRANDGANGPKRSIRASIKELNSTGRLFVASGRYNDKINIRGKDIKVFIAGVTLLTDKTKEKPE